MGVCGSEVGVNLTLSRKYACVNMITYQFRIRFFAKGNSIAYPGDEQGSFSLQVDDKTFDFRAFRKEESFWGGEWHVITCGGFSTEQEAWEAGNRCKNALYMLGVKMRRSLDLGKDEATSNTNDAFKKTTADAAREAGYEVQLYDNVHGLAAYPETPVPQFLEFSAYGTVEGPPKPTFSEVFEESYRLNWNLNDRESLACALYGAAQAEVSARAKFLFLVNVTESLIESKERAPQALEHVEQLIEVTRTSALERSAKESLLASLSWHRYESINHMCKELITRHLGEKRYGGKKAQHFFRDCYSIRSDLLHTGKSNVEENMLSINDLDMLVQDLLDSMLQKSPTDDV